MSDDDDAEAPAGTDILAGLGFTRESWTARGACRGADAGAFFTVRGEATAPAKAVCATCPVIEECLDYALRNGERYGIWGGTSERERKRMRREMRAAAGHSPRGPLPATADRYARVADIARHCVGTSTAAADAVADEMGVSRAAASALISRARKHGHQVPYDYRASA